MKRFWGLLLAAVLVLLPLAVLGEAAGGFTFCDNGDGTVTLTGYTGTSRSVAIPGTYEGAPVTAIGSHAFLRTAPCRP